MNKRILTLTTMGALVASLALAGCNKTDQADAKAKVGDATAKVEEKAREVGADASAGMEKAKDAASNATATMGEKIDDAVITASVKTELAKDSDLSALKINVDTDGGRVALKGIAPNSGARDRATGLAQAVKGVVSVDNQLTVGAAEKM
jgi:hyperosmotically inducible periplasmic protein